jgi:Raf kinase inhibitor-like YbhB/YbcL family protein
MNSRLGWFAGCLLFLGSFREATALGISCPAFAAGQGLAPRFAHTHQNISPPLQLSGAPPGAQSLALIVDDPDAPSGLFTHWVMWNIPPQTLSIPEGASSSTPPGVQGRNSFGDTHYDGPAPPNGRHRYFFHLYALDTTLGLAVNATRSDLLAAMKGHVLARAEMFGTFATGQ